MDDLISKEQMRKILSFLKDYIDNRSNGVNSPLGTIISYMGTTAPSNYLACDGTIYIIAEYKELANFFKSQFGSYNFFGGDGETTFAVPDLRGEFLRGTGTNSHANQGNGANVGIHQDGTEIPNMFTANSNQIYGYKSNSENQFFDKSDSELTRATYQTYFINGTNAIMPSDLTAPYAVTSRPTNTSVLYCIRYNSPQSYSTTEKVIGTWIDGKPLYQRTYTESTISSNVHTVNTSLNSSNYTIIKLYGHIADAVNTYSVPYVDGGYTVGCYLNKSTGAVTIRATNSSKGTATFTFIHLTIQYTKTTD